jgi:hypothetical protein
MAERLAYLIARFQWHLLAVWFVAMAAADLASLSLPGRRAPVPAIFQPAAQRR